MRGLRHKRAFCDTAGKPEECIIMFTTRAERLRFSEALIGLLFEPISTCRSLLAAGSPFFLIGLVVLFLLFAFLPLVYVELTTIPMLKGLPAIFGLAILFFTSFFFFIIFQCVLLLLLGSPLRLSGVFSISIFALAPAVVGLFVLFGLDYLNTGTFSSALMLTRGEQWFNRGHASLFMYTLAGFQLLIFFCYFCYLRVLCSMGIMNALFTTALSILTLSCALSLGVLSSKVFCPSCLTPAFRMIGSYAQGLPFL
jgi:hypothetical protein